jgi:M6 family metalloprotease-like protein
MHSILSVLVLIASGFESPGFRPIQLDRVPKTPILGAGRALSTGARTIHFAVVPLIFADGDSTWGSDTLGKTFTGPTREVSVKDFYDEQSRGAVSLDFQICPWRRTTAKRTDCAEQNANYGNCLVRLMRDALRSAVASGISPASLDNDGDSTLDGLLVVYNGPDYQSSGSTADPLCARFSAGSSDTTVAGGYTLVQALFLPETEDGRIMKAGSPAHEIGHILGLPDIYDDDDAAHGQDGGMGTWELMDMGGLGVRYDPILGVYPRWKPVGMSAFCTARLGWTTPLSVDSEQDVRLTPGQSARIWTDPYHALQYLLVENRDRSRSDSVLPGPGLLATRVRPVHLPILRYGVAHMVNADSSDMGLLVIEGSGDHRIQSNSAPWASIVNLFGPSTSDSLTPAGPFPFANPDSSNPDVWLRGIQVDGNDVVFRAHPSQVRGYALPAVPDTVGGTSFGVKRLILLTTAKVPAAGKVRAISTVIPSSAGTITTSIWSSRRNPMPTALATTTDVGIAGSVAVARWNWLDTPVAVSKGQILYIGTDASTPDGSNVYFEASEARTGDSTWFWTPSTSFLTSSFKPAVQLLIETTPATTSVPSVPGSDPAAGLRIHRAGSRVRITGAAPDRIVELSATDLSGRTLWRTSLLADGTGAAAMPLPAGGQVRILRVRSAGTASPSLIDLP